MHNCLSSTIEKASLMWSNLNPYPYPYPYP